MSKQKQAAQRELTPLEKLGLRVSAMINSPKAQLEREVTIHRLDTDPDEAWGGVLELLREEQGLALDCNEDGSITLRWGVPGADDERIEEAERLELVDVSPF